MQVHGFSHLAIAVGDLDKSLDFYCNLLGLKLFTRYQYKDFAPKESGAGVGLAKGKGADWAGSAAARSFALVHLAPPEAGRPTPFLSLTDLPRGEHVKPEFWNWGMHHFGIWVEGFDETLARLQAAGVPVAAKTVSSDSFNWAMETGKLIRAVVVRDPDGNLVQLDEMLA